MEPNKIYKKFQVGTEDIFPIRNPKTQEITEVRALIRFDNSDSNDRMQVIIVQLKLGQFTKHADFYYNESDKVFKPLSEGPSERYPECPSQWWREEGIDSDCPDWFIECYDNASTELVKISEFEKLRKKKVEPKMKLTLDDLIESLMEWRSIYGNMPVSGCIKDQNGRGPIKSVVLDQYPDHMYIELW